MHRGDRSDLALFGVKLTKCRDVDIGKAIAVGQHERWGVFEVPGCSCETAAGQGVQAGVGHGDLEVFGAIVAVVLGLVGGQVDR